MRMTPPAGFNAAEFSGVFTCFQEWEIFPGHVIAGVKQVKKCLDRLQFPADLSGLRILDIGPWNGFFGFECLRRGAAELVSLGPDDPQVTGYNKTRDLLEVGNCQYIRSSVYDLSPDIHGTFDIVLFFGVLYHLRHPLLALDRIYSVARNRLFVDCAVIDSEIFDRTISEKQRRKILKESKFTNQLPMLYFSKGKETGDPYNWFIPNKRALIDLVEASGFALDACVMDNGLNWAFLAGTKSDHILTIGREGWNEAAARPKRRVK